MKDSVEIDLTKTYEFYLDGNPKVAKLGSHSRVILNWIAVDIPVEVYETFSFIDNKPGPRLTALLSRLGYKQPKDTLVDAAVLSFFKRGMHVWSMLQKQWTESKIDATTYDFIYPTITTRPTTERKVDAAIRNRILTYVRGLTTRDQMTEKIKSINPDYLRELENMIADGTIVVE